MQAREETYTTLNIYWFDILLESTSFQIATNAEELLTAKNTLLHEIFQIY